MAFTIAQISEKIKTSMVSSNIWQPKCPVPLNKLRLIEVEYYNFDGDVLPGQLVVADIMAENVVNIFQELYRLKFPIHKIALIDEYNGDDEESMKANNSSSFNFRTIAGASNLSMHAYGLAIDINPLQNPYVRINHDLNELYVSPWLSVNYLNRANQRKGMVEPIVHVFKQNGYEVWGGDWDWPLDYHHFQVNQEISDKFLKEL